MTIEIHRPEVEALISRLMETGLFHDIEEALLHALRTAPLPSAVAKQSLGEAADGKVRALTEDVGFPGEANRPKRRLNLDPPLIPPAGRRIRVADEEIYDLIEFP